MKSRTFNTTKRNSKRFISVMLSIIIAISLIPLSAFNAFAGIDEYNSIGILRNDGTDSVTSINWFNPACLDLSVGASRNFNGVTITCNNSYTLTFNGNLSNDVDFGCLPISMETGSSYTISVKHISGSVTNGSGRLVFDYINKDFERIDLAGLPERYNFDFIGTGSDTRTIPNNSYSSTIRGIKFWAWKNSGLSFNNFKIEIRIFKGTMADEPMCNPANISPHARTNGSFFSVTPPTREGYDFLGYWDSPSEFGYKCINADGSPVEGRTVPNVGKMVLFARWATKPLFSNNSFIQANKEAGGNVLFRNGCVLNINNVYSGTQHDYWNRGIEDGMVSGPVYFNRITDQVTNPNLSQTVIYVDPDITPNLLDSRVQIQLKIPSIASSVNRARWGVEITQYSPTYTYSITGEDWNHTTITTQNEKNITYYLTDAVGNNINSGVTSGDITLDATINNNSAYGPYYWYIKGATPEAGDKATIRVLGACGAWAQEGNLQWMTVYTDLTVISVSKTALKNAINTPVVTLGATATELSAYNTALENAIAVKDKPNAEQSEVDQATNALNDAIQTLKYKVYLDPNGGILDGSTNGKGVNVAFGTAQTANLDVSSYVPTKEGYVFLGWAKSSTATSGSTTTVNVGFNEHLYAVYTEKYSINYNLNGGTVDSNPEFFTSATPSFTLNNPTRTGYDFTGWTGSNGSTAQTSVTISQGSTGNKTYTANWEAIDYTIAYNLDGGNATNPSGYNVETATFTLENPTKIGYTFTGWTGANGETPETSVSIAQGSTGDKAYTANWTINSYTVTFKDYDGSTLYSNSFNYGATPVYNGATPARATDNNYKYTFSGWDRAFETVTAEATYTAQYEQTAHIYKYESISATQHRKFCETCAHEADIEAHEFEYRKINSSKNAYVCAKCGYTEEIEATQYTVTVPTGCEVTQALKPTLSNSYFVATVTAPKERINNGVKEYFVYWIDGDGNIVSTYYKYSFFAVKNASFTPVYATQDDYYTEKDKGLYASRVVDVRDNNDGKSYSIFVEHSVSKSTPVDENNKHLNGHGVIYTASTVMPTDFTLDNQNLIKKSAAVSTSNTLTGMLEVTVEPGSESGLWVRTYVTDINGEVHYSEPVYKSFANIETNSDEMQTLSTMSFDCTSLNELENDAVNEPAEEPTENPTGNTFDTLISLWKIIVGIIDRIFSIFKGVSL